MFSVTCVQAASFRNSQSQIGNEAFMRRDLVSCMYCSRGIVMCDA